MEEDGVYLFCETVIEGRLVQKYELFSWEEYYKILEEGVDLV